MTLLRETELCMNNDHQEFWSENMALELEWYFCVILPNLEFKIYETAALLLGKPSALTQRKDCGEVQTKKHSDMGFSQGKSL